MDAADARDCFNCHATRAVVNNRLNIETMAAGVQCERCHAGADRHATMQKVSALSTEEISDLCGGCHRTWAQIAASGPRGILNVRFQPYRLTNSKCYDAADRRISCVACHNPHTHAARDAAFYDSKCTACHSAANAAHVNAKLCPVAKANCVSCHMPKIDLPGAHFAFTDHFIRIARPGEAYPN